MTSGGSSLVSPPLESGARDERQKRTTVLELNPRAFLQWVAMLAALVPSLAWAQAAAPRSAVVRITPGVTGKIPGTGFIVKLGERRAYVLTAAHVVEGDPAPKVEFFTQRDSQFTARVADGTEWDDPRALALLVVDGPLPSGLSELPIDASTQLEGGEAIIAIGHPAGGGSWAVVPGSVTTRQGRVVYFAAPVDKGNSGGPLLHGGKVVGLVTSKGPTFGEAVAASAMLAFLEGSRIDVGLPPTPPTSTPSPPVVGSRPARLSPERRNYRAGEVFADCSSCPEMVVVPAGKFTMGSPAGEAGRLDKEGPQHEVTFAHPFAVGRFEVTRGQFRPFVRAKGWELSGGCHFYDNNEWKLGETRSWENPGYVQTDDHPVVCVSHEDAQQYVKWLSQETKQTYRLLTRSRVGIRCPGRNHHAALLERLRTGCLRPCKCRRSHGKAEVRVGGHSHLRLFRRLRRNRAGGPVQAERLRTVRHAGQRVGMGGGLR